MLYFCQYWHLRDHFYPLHLQPCYIISVQTQASKKSASKRMRSEKKSGRLDIRVTESDRQALKNLAQSQGQNLSAFLRSLPTTYAKKEDTMIKSVVSDFIAKQNSQAA